MIFSNYSISNKSSYSGISNLNVSYKSNRCWSNSIIQMLYNIIEFRNKLIFNTPKINTETILSNYTHSKPINNPKDINKNDFPLLGIAALKNILRDYLMQNYNIPIFLVLKNIKFLLI